MVTIAKILQGKYLDSVKLMLISKQVREQTGVHDAVVILATAENREILASTNMLVDSILLAKESDIVIVIKAENKDIGEKALALAESLLETPTEQAHGKSRKYFSIETAASSLDNADLCLISIAGKYAAAEAENALKNGLHVMLFSDNVSISDELQLKQLAVEKGLLMMGPDCGTAIINGVPLAFANKIGRGRIGIVAASGTGLQEASCALANRGYGISQAFGTGGRDGKKEIGGLMILACLDYLMQDEATKVILLISKTPDFEVQEQIWDKLSQSGKPIVVNFLQDVELPSLPMVEYCSSLDGSALMTINALRRMEGQIEITESIDCQNMLPQIGKHRQYIRGLYSGGTLCYEAQQIYFKSLGQYASSNAPLGKSNKIADAWKPEGDCFIDLGADEFTVGRPHPMIDFSLRMKMLEAVASDPKTAIILLDIVLGFGAHPNPSQEIVPLLARIPKDIAVVCHVLGTNEDPQDVSKQVSAIAETGAMVFRSHHQAATFALRLLAQHKSGV